MPVTNPVRVVVSDARTFTFEALMFTPVMLEVGVMAAIFKLMAANLPGSATLPARITVVLEAFRLGALNVTLVAVIAPSVPAPL